MHSLGHRSNPVSDTYFSEIRIIEISSLIAKAKKGSFFVNNAIKYLKFYFICKKREKEAESGQANCVKKAKRRTNSSKFFFPNQSMPKQNINCI